MSLARNQGAKINNFDSLLCPWLHERWYYPYLKENGLKYDKRKLNVYYHRGKIPEPDLELGGTTYWSRASVESFCEQEKSRLKTV